MAPYTTTHTSTRISLWDSYLLQPHCTPIVSISQSDDPWLALVFDLCVTYRGVALRYAGIVILLQNTSEHSLIIVSRQRLLILTSHKADVNLLVESLLVIMHQTGRSYSSFERFLLLSMSSIEDCVQSPCTIRSVWL